MFQDHHIVLGTCITQMTLVKGMYVHVCHVTSTWFRSSQYIYRCIIDTLNLLTVMSKYTSRSMQPRILFGVLNLRTVPCIHKRRHTGNLSFTSSTRITRGTTIEGINIHHMIHTDCIVIHTP